MWSEERAALQIDTSFPQPRSTNVVSGGCLVSLMYWWAGVIQGVDSVTQSNTHKNGIEPHIPPTFHVQKTSLVRTIVVGPSMSARD